MINEAVSAPASIPEIFPVSFSGVFLDLVRVAGNVSTLIEAAHYLNDVLLLWETLGFL